MDPNQYLTNYVSLKGEFKYDRYVPFRSDIWIQTSTG